MFADDTTLLYSHPDIASRINCINKELSEISNWFKANKLSVNASKTNYMMLGTSHITNKYIDASVNCSNDDIHSFTDIAINNINDDRPNKQQINVILNDVSLERVSSTKFLGVIIDENLTWKNHIEQYPRLFLEILECCVNLNIMYLDILCIPYIVPLFYLALIMLF